MNIGWIQLKLVEFLQSDRQWVFFQFSFQGVFQYPSLLEYEFFTLALCGVCSYMFLICKEKKKRGQNTLKLKFCGCRADFLCLSQFSNSAVMLQLYKLLRQFPFSPLRQEDLTLQRQWVFPKSQVVGRDAKIWEFSPCFLGWVLRKKENVELFLSVQVAWGIPRPVSVSSPPKSWGLWSNLLKHFCWIPFLLRQCAEETLPT